MGVAIPAAIGLGAVSIGAGILQGESQKRAQKRASRRQAEAQRLATSRAASEQRRQEQAQRRLDRRRPDTAALLGEARTAQSRGPGATLLTGSAGVQSQNLTLGRASLLGGGS